MIFFEKIFEYKADNFFVFMVINFCILWKDSWFFHLATQA